MTAAAAPEGGAPAAGPLTGPRPPGADAGDDVLPHPTAGMVLHRVLAQAARTFGVCRQSVAAWIEQVESGGTRVLAARKRGPKPRPRMDAASERGAR